MKSLSKNLLTKPSTIQETHLTRTCPYPWGNWYSLRFVALPSPVRAKLVSCLPAVRQPCCVIAALDEGSSDLFHPRWTHGVKMTDSPPCTARPTSFILDGHMEWRWLTRPLHSSSDQFHPRWTHGVKMTDSPPCTAHPVHVTGILEVAFRCWLFPRLQGLWENVRPFITRLRLFCVCVCVCVLLF